MKKFFRKIFINFLIVVLTLSGFNYVPVRAEDQEDNDDFQVEEIDLEDYGIESSKEKAKKHRFLDVFDGDPRDNISVVVELEDEPVVEKEIKAGKSAFRSVIDLDADTKKLEAKQNRLTKDIKKVDKTAKVKEHFTYLSNSMVMDLKAEHFDEVKDLSGVKRLFVEREYYIPQPQMNSSNEIVNAFSVWDQLGYEGEGMTVGVLDTGLDTEHPAFTQDLEDTDKAALDEGKLADFADTHKEVFNADFDKGQDLYNNLKVPFTYDYAEQRISVKPNTENHNDVNHGTHVAGTVGGKDNNDFKGVAPESQLLIFKVFNDEGSGATDAVIMSALEDAVLLGIDAINMSLGSDAGFTSEADDFTDDLYHRINDAGILLSASAGNAHSNAMNNTYGLDYTLAADPDHGVVGSPSTYDGPLSIASSENTKMPVNYFEVDGEIYTYTDTDHSITDIVGEHEFVFVPGVGEEEDFEGVDVKDKIAFIQRGDIVFGDKILNAEEREAKAVIVYGTDDTSVNMDVGESTIPSAYITKSAAEDIVESEATTLTITDEEKIVDNPEANLPSSFSSMGTTNTLNIKPELTAPGGQIYSALPTQGSKDYGLMSGTSMAAPHVAGGAALLKQYIKDKHSDLDDSEVLKLMDKLLMSTANIVKLEEGYVSVREQGAGVMDLEKAMTTNAYLSVDSSQNGDNTSRPKLELGDNPSADGKFTLTFKVTNFGDEIEEYDIQTMVTAPAVGDAEFDEPFGTKSFMLDQNIELDSEVTGPKEIAVNPGETETVELQLQVDQNKIAELSERFVNGFYAEGFVELKNKTESKVDLNIPYLGFIGDWEAARIFDYVNDNDVEFDGKVESLHSHVLGSEIDDTLLNLGTSVFHDNPEEMYADYDRLVVSPNGDGYFDTLDTVILGQLRNAEELNLILKDEEGKTVYDQNRENAFKSYYHGTLAQIVTYTHFVGNGFDEVTFEGLSDGKYRLEFEADLGYRSGVNDSLGYDIYVDTVAPELNKVTNKDDELTIEFSDDQFLLYSELAIGIFDEEGDLKLEAFDNIHTPYGENENHEFNIDLENIELDSSDVFVATSVDAGYNETAYLITPEAVGQPEDEIWAMQVGDTRTISPQDYELLKPSFEVDDEEIVEVNQDGEVKALAVGQTTIHVSDAIGDFSIEVHVVDKGLEFKENEYITRVNEVVDLELLFNDELLEYNEEELTFEYDEAAFEQDGLAFKALKEGNYPVKATYDYEGKVQLDILESEDENSEDDGTAEDVEESDNNASDEDTAEVEEEKEESEEDDDSEDNEETDPEDKAEEDSEKDVDEAADGSESEKDKKETKEEPEDNSETKENSESSESSEKTNELYEAITVIKVKALDKKVLQLLIDNFKELPEEVYSEKSLKRVMVAYDQAVEVLESDEVTQEEIDEAVKKLIEAQEKLKYAVQGLEDEYEITVGQNLQLKPAPAEGSWEYDHDLLIIDRHLNGYRLVGLNAGETVITFTNNDGESKDVLIKVKSKESDDKDPEKPEKPGKEDDKDDGKDKGNKKGDKKKRPGSSENKDNKDKSEGKDGDKNSNLPKTGTSDALLPYALLLLGLGLTLLVIRLRKKS